MKYFNWEIVKQIVHRAFKSKVVLGSIGGAIATIVWSLLEINVNPIVDRIVEALWALWIIYSAANNPTTQDTF